LRYTKWTKEQGAIGSDDSGFAIFPDEETGKAAQQKLLFSGETIYKSDTIESAINKYAPQNENNTQAYIEHITKATGLSPNTPLSSLTSDQQESMLDVMKQHEGWSVGREIPDLALTEQSANKKQLLVIPMNMPSKGGILPGDNSLGNIPGGSTIDSATPSFMTHDPFIEFGMQT
jgi:hypothetical protein